MQRAIKEVVIRMAMTKNKIEKINLKNLEQTEISKFCQFICSGLLKFIDFMINGVFPMKSWLAGGFAWQQMNFVNWSDNLSNMLNFRQKFTNFSFDLNVLK